MSWSFVILVAVGFGILYAWNMYKNYKKADDADKPKLVKIYAGVAIITSLIFLGLKLFIPSVEVEYINEQEHFQQKFIDDIISPTETENTLNNKQHNKTIYWQP